MEDHIITQVSSSSSSSSSSLFEELHRKRQSTNLNQKLKKKTKKGPPPLPDPRNRFQLVPIELIVKIKDYVAYNSFQQSIRFLQALIPLDEEPPRRGYTRLFNNEIFRLAIKYPDWIERPLSKENLFKEIEKRDELVAQAKKEGRTINLSHLMLSGEHLKKKPTCVYSTYCDVSSMQTLSILWQGRRTGAGDTPKDFSRADFSSHS